MQDFAAPLFHQPVVGQPIATRNANKAYLLWKLDILILADPPLGELGAVVRHLVHQHAATKSPDASKNKLVLQQLLVRWGSATHSLLQIIACQPEKLVRMKSSTFCTLRADTAEACLNCWWCVELPKALSMVAACRFASMSFGHDL